MIRFHSAFRNKNITVSATELVTGRAVRDAELLDCATDIESVNLPRLPIPGEQDVVHSPMNASKCLIFVQILAQKAAEKGSPTRPWSDATDKDYYCEEIVFKRFEVTR
jgi:hypothetical protein